MNKLQLATLITCTVVMSACSKQTTISQMPADNLAANLQSGDWKMTAFTTSPALNGVTDVIANMPPCANDNLLQFRANGLFVLDEGPTKCNASDAQTDAGTWNYDATIRQLTYASPRAGSFVIDVSTSSPTSLSGTRTVVMNGVTYHFSGTLTKQ
jgi:hypothetical protein